MTMLHRMSVKSDFLKTHFKYDLNAKKSQLYTGCKVMKNIEKTDGSYNTFKPLGGGMKS